MRRPRSAFSRPAAGVVATLALVLIASATIRSDVPTYARVVMLATAASGAAGAVALWRDSTYTAWVANLMLVVVAASGAVAVSLLGLPGRVCAGFGACSIAVICLALLFVVLLALDARRRAAHEDGQAPYAL